MKNLIMLCLLILYAALTVTTSAVEEQITQNDTDIYYLGHDYLIFIEEIC